MGTCVCRFHARRRREAKSCEEMESSDLNHTPNKKKMEIRAPPAKPAASKTSVLQSIYGEIIHILHKNMLFLFSCFFFIFMCVTTTNQKTKIRSHLT